MQSSNFWKYAALAAAGAYVYHLSKEKGSSLSGKIGPFSINPSVAVDAITPLLNIKNPIVRLAFSHGVKGFLNGYLGEDSQDVIDAKYRVIR